MDDDTYEWAIKGLVPTILEVERIHQILQTEPCMQFTFVI